MNLIDDQLQRLFKAAAQTERSGLESAPFVIETRVIAGWRAGLAAEGRDLLLAWCRRATVCACLLMLLSLAWNYRQTTTGQNDELAQADSAMRMALNQ
ncbi:MAG TPA: hypothetical protein VH598_02600 [Verrucomicrobiae bacterium]|jgi:hypothetical protein|nr:hypothetical protein [Verrucomicrobiae bacterium]